MKDKDQQINDTTTSVNAKTVWSSINELLKCQWGLLRYEDWCRKESSRMNDSGATSVVRYRTYDSRRQCCIANQ